MPLDPSRPYNLGLTAATLRPELARVVAEIYLEAGSWPVVKEKVLSSNALQARSKESARRMEREFRHRVSTLSEDQITLLARSTGEDRIAIAWLAVSKRFPFAFEFAAEVLRGKFEQHDPVLRPSDYESYVEEKTVLHPELSGLTASTKGKIRRFLMRMLVEAGLLGEGRATRPVHRPILSRPALDAITSEDPCWLAGFLVPDREVAQMKDRSI